MKAWATIARVGSLGDNLMAASVFAPLKRQGFNVEMLTSTPNHVVYFNNPHVDKLSVIDRETDIPHPDPKDWQDWFVQRSKQSDVFVNLSHSVELKHCLLREQGAFWWYPEVRRWHCAGNYLESIHRICRVPFEFGPLYFASADELEQAFDYNKRLDAARTIVWVLSGSRIDRRYPNAGIAIARLIRECDATVILTAAPSVETFNDAKAIMAEVVKHNGNDKGFGLAVSPNGSLTWGLRRALAQLMVADLVVGPDTGPMWAVAMEDRPKVIMLSNSSAENVTKHWKRTVTLHADPTRVGCYPCHRLHESKATCVPNADDTGAACMSNISVECLVTACQAALGDGPSQVTLRKRFGSNVAEQSWGGFAHAA